MKTLNRIKKLRTSQSKTQAELANAVGVTRQTVSLYEAGEREPKGTVWQKLADALGVSVSYLQGISDNPSDKPTQADFTRWDTNLEKIQANQANTILNAISPDTLASLDFEECSGRLGILNETLTFAQSNPKQVFDLLTLLVRLNGNDKTDYPSSELSDDFRQQVLNALN